MYKHKITNEQVLALLEQGLSIQEVSRQLSVNRSSVLKRLKKLDIHVPNRQTSTKFNDRKFDVIDTEQKAYWLGFLFADGYLSASSYNMELSLSIKDRTHLQKFADFLEYPNNVKTDSFRCRFSITNKHLWGTLNKLGCTPRKSLTLKFPSPEIFKNPLLIRDFIRGYFDGDGCVYFTKTGRLSCSILGTKEFITEMVKHIGIPRNLFQRNPDKNTFTVQYSHSTADSFCNYLYSDATIYLDRKYNKYRFAVSQSDL